ncbi:DNA mismatch repair protein mutS [Gemmatirosa kalamazoonensis]|uniref:DNA mismatch repair protein MutS n=2 Tax=Gemmatirosa kalamazoonensis TaxID=861299 RepID=W0RDN4_9BACT|nr:DNA mismatch repair protein mutS [Gemmatirosa kalamazoonensis]
MQQYREIKARHQGSILFFRMGDFYETFEDDAVLASRVLGLTLTSRNNGGASDVPLAGVPVKAVNEYVRRLVARGYRVAICEQVEDPRLAKGIVRREVIETVTPGAAFSDDLLDCTRNNFLCAVRPAPGALAVAAADVSTGELRLATVPSGDADALLARLAPREVLLPKGGETTQWRAMDGALVTEREAWEFDPAMARDDLARQYGVLSLDGLGIGAEDEAALGAAGALLRYLRELQPGGVPHLARPIVERAGGAMPLDEMTRRNLELVESLRPGVDNDRAGTLLGVLDRTQTPMGTRLLRQWILAPLTRREDIDMRLDAVAATAGDAIGRATLREALDGVRDVERLASKAAAGRATPRELRALGDSLGRLPAVHGALERVIGTRDSGLGTRVPDESRVPSPESRLTVIAAAWDDCGELCAEVTRALVERPPLQLGDESTIATGVDTELDDLRALRDGGKDAIAEIQAAERERTGIQSLKVGYNKVFGYFIEISNAHRERVPDDYQRRQTLTNGERYVTPDLKAYEEKVLGAAERIEARERELFESLRACVGREIARLQRVAGALAELDVLAALAEVAEREGYVRPTLTDGYDLEIVAGRHPVVERMMAREKFIPNDVTLTQDARLVILTGPNMAGKSTILRQVGLVVLMAQMGSFVPASRATIGLVDRLFTRVGASDNLVRGQSTFMVEMTETSAILNTATARSLVLLDEIGRGTSTYDGVSIAWSVSEHLHDHVGCKTIFATHYHELVQLAEELPAVRNFTVAVREVGDQVLFLHRLVPGGADRSYGIEVGRLAGLPAPVIARAKEVLALLEGDAATMAESLGRVPAAGKRSRRRAPPADQLALFASAPPAAAPNVVPPPPHPVVEALRATDPNHVTPMQALELLARLRAQIHADA